MLPGVVSGAGVSDSGGIARVEAARLIEFDRSPQVMSAVFSEDGGSLYVHLHTSMLDIGAAIGAYLTWIGGFVLLLLLLVVVWRAWLVHRRPRKVGEVYCRRCNYDVGSQVRRAEGTGAAQVCVVCPECGVDLVKRDPVRGRGRLARLGPMLAVFGVFAGLYVGLVVTGVVGRGWSWPSMRAADAVERFGAGAWLTNFIKDFDRFVAVDPRTGLVEREIAVRDPVSYSTFAMGVGDETLFRVSSSFGVVQGATADFQTVMRLEVIDAGSGLTVATREVAGIPIDGVMAGKSSVIAFERGGDVALIAALFDREHVVGAWNWREDSWRVIASRSVNMAETVGVPVLPAWIVSANRKLDPSVLVCASGLVEALAANQKFFEVFVRESGGEDWRRAGGRRFSVGPTSALDIESVSGMASQTVVLDGSVVLIGAGSTRSTVVGFTLPELEPIGLLQFSARSSPMADRIASGRVGRLIAYGDDLTSTLLVRDVAGRRWAAVCAYDADAVGRRFIGKLPMLSPDGRRAALLGFFAAQGNPQTGYPSGIMLWDLSGAYLGGED